MTVALAVPQAERYDLKLGWLADAGAAMTTGLGSTRMTIRHRTSGCEATELGRFELDRTTRLTVETTDDVLVDYIELTPAKAK